MSQATENAPSRTQLLGDELRSKVLITARTIKTVELLSQLIWLGILFLVAVFSVVLFEHWVMPLGVWLRLAVWMLFVVAGTYVLIWRILPLALRSIHPAYAARQIEQSMPEMKNSLISWLELAQQNEYVPKGILASVGRYAQRSLVGKDVHSLVDQATVIRMGAVLVGLLLVGSTYLAVSPKSGLDSVRRILFPWAKIAAPTRVRILNVQPGDTTVIQGQNLPIHADVQGIRAGEAVFVRFETGDGQMVDQRVRMDMEIERLSYQIDFGANFGGIHQPMRYWVEAGDAAAGPYQISVRAVPLVAVEEVRYDFPAYTKLMPRIVSGDGRVDALEGTILSIRASANQPMKQARLEITRDVEGGKFLTATRLAEFQVEDRSITGSWLLELDEKKSNPSKYLYRVRALNELGSWNEQPIAYPMKVVADLPPEVQIISPPASPIPLPINEILNLQVRAIDPDFGLRRLDVAIKKGEVELGTQELIVHDEGVLGQHAEDFVLRPAEWRLKEGDLVELFAVAEDNRHRPGANELQPNRTVSMAVQVKIEPASTKPENAENQSKNQDSTNDTADATRDKKQQGDKKSDDQSVRDDSISDQEKQKDSTSSKNRDQNKNRDPKQDRQKDSTASQSNDSSQKSSSESQPDTQNSNKESGGQDNSSKTKEQSKSSKNNSKQGGNRSNSNQGESNQQKIGQAGADQNDSNQRGSSQNGANQNDANRNGSNQSGETQKGSSPSQAGENGATPSEPSGKKPEHDGDVIEEVERFMEEQQNEKPSNSNNDSTSTEANGLGAAGKDTEGSKSSKSDQNQLQNQAGKETATGEQSAREKDNNPKSQSETSGAEQSQKQQPNSNQSQGDNSSRDASKRNSTKGDPTKGDPTNGNSTKGDPTKSDKASDDRETGDPSKSVQSKEDQSKDNHSKGDSPKGGSPKGDQSNGDQSNADQAKGDQTKGDQSKADQSKADQSKADQSKADQSKADQTKGDQTKGEFPGGDPSDSNQPQGDQPSGKQSSNDPSGDRSNSDRIGDGNSVSDRASKDPSGNSQSNEKQADGQSSQGIAGEANNSESGEKEGERSESDGARQQGEGGSPSGGGKQKSGDSGSSGGQSDAAEGQQQGSSSSEQASGSGGQNGSKKEQGKSDNRGQSQGGARQAPNGGQPGQEPQVSDGSSPDQSDPANVNYARKTTDLVLDYLDRQRDQPDPKLLQRLNWTADDLRAFVDRWKKAKRDAELDPSKRKEFEDSLKSLGLVPKATVNRTQGKDDLMRGMQEEGNRVLPPESLREQFDAFRRALQENADRSPKKPI